MTMGAEEYWDRQVATFDQLADHGLQDPAVRRAWSGLLLPLLPSPPASIVDLGCGTGTLSLLLAQAGYQVHGVDLSARMLDVAHEKAEAARMQVRFTQADAADPPVEPGSCDVVLARHALWVMTDPDAALARWTDLLAPTGRLMLIEGCWSGGAGLTADRCRDLVLQCQIDAEITRLDDPALWGRPISDERYLLLSRRWIHPRHFPLVHPRRTIGVPRARRRTITSS